MPLTITTPTLIEIDPHNYSVEASAIGLAPGEWPSAIEIDFLNCSRMTMRYMNADATEVQYELDGSDIFVSVLKS